MDDEKKRVTKGEGAPVKPEKMSALKKPTPTGKKTDDLEDRLDHLFVDIDDRPVPEVTAPKPAAVIPEKGKGRDDLIIIDAAKNKKDGDGPLELRPPALVTIDEGKIKEAFKKPDASVRKNKVSPDSRPPKAAAHPPDKESKTEKEKKADLNHRTDEKKAADDKKVPKASREYKKNPAEAVGFGKSSNSDIEIIERVEIIDPEVSQQRLYRNKFVWGGILMVLAVTVSFIVFKPFARVEGDGLQKTVIARKIDQPPGKKQTTTVNSPSDIIIAKKTDPVVPPDTTPSRKGPEAKAADPLVENEKNVLNAPPVSYPYSIHAESYRSLRSAQQSAETHLKTGLQAFWVRVDLGEKGFWYRVFIDCYKDSATAQKVIKEKQLKDARPFRVGYANFIGDYLSSADLTKQSRLLSERGYSSYFIQDDKGKNYLYTGAFDTEKEAERFAVELRSKGIRSMVVER